MKNYLKLTIILLAAVVITSCAALRYPDMTKISIGMNKAEVQAALRSKPTGIVGAKKYPAGQIEVQQYVTGVLPNGHPELSWLYFYNDKLIQFGQPDGEWQYNADNIADVQARGK